ncbi:MAG: glycosyltransferase family 39 protein [Mariprofundales bacterium]
MYAYLAIWIIFSLISLGLAPLFDYDETVYAQTAADMLTAGTWVLPYANGMPFFEKPPLLYDLMQLSLLAFGHNSFAIRLPSWLFTVITAIYLIYAGRRGQNMQLGLLAAAIFVSMLEVGLLAHAAILDAALNCLVAIAIIEIWWWRQSKEKDKQKHALFAAIACGIGISIKGPVGAAIPVMVFVLDRLWQQDLWASIKAYPWLKGSLLLLIFAAPWYILLVYQHGWDFLREFVLVQNIGRFSEPMQGHGGRWYYYILVFCVSVLPWLAWVRHAGYQALRDMRLIRLGLVWTISVIVLFSFAGTKLPHYISSIYPGIALSLAAFLYTKEQTFQINKNYGVCMLLSAILLCLPVAIAVAALPWLYDLLPIWVHHPRALAIIGQELQPDWTLFISGLIFATLLLWVWIKRQQAVMGTLIIGLALQIMLFVSVAPFAGTLLQQPLLNIAAEVKLRENIPVFSLNLNYPSVSFYSGRNYQILLDSDGVILLQQYIDQNKPYLLIIRDESLPLVQSMPLDYIIQQGGFSLLAFKNTDN